jgi:DnaJ-class molecular chaperone
MTVICPHCKGKGYVFNPLSLMLTVALPIAMILESNSDEGITKNECYRCDGDGFIKYEE